MGFDPCNRTVKIRECIWGSNSQHGSSIGSVRVHSFTLFALPKSMWCDSWVSFLARNLAISCLGREPKVRVATRFMYLSLIEERYYCWVSMWQFHVAMMTCELLLTWKEYIFIKVYFDMSSKVVKEYSSWHGWNIIEICLLALVHRFMLSIIHSPQNNL
jgi:hypothetical protein